MSNELKVADNHIVSLKYRLKLDDGDIVDESTPGDPLKFLQGSQQIIPGLEKELYGLKVGDTRNVTVAPDEAYGEPDPDEFQAVERTLFPPELELEVGMGLQLRDQNSGQPVIAYVDKISSDSVVLDFNHPLAGETLFFDIEVVDIRTATDEEIAHGHAH